MPIGFWAVSRTDVHDALRRELLKEPTKEQVDRIIRVLPSLLETELAREILKYAKGQLAT